MKVLLVGFSPAHLELIGKLREAGNEVVVQELPVIQGDRFDCGVIDDDVMVAFAKLERQIAPINAPAPMSRGQKRMHKRIYGGW